VLQSCVTLASGTQLWSTLGEGDAEDTDESHHRADRDAEYEQRDEHDHIERDGDLPGHGF